MAFRHDKSKWAKQKAMTSAKQIERKHAQTKKTCGKLIDSDELDVILIGGGKSSEMDYDYLDYNYDTDASWARKPKTKTRS